MISDYVFKGACKNDAENDYDNVKFIVQLYKKKGYNKTGEYLDLFNKT